MDKALVYNFAQYFEHNLQYKFAEDSLEDNRARAIDKAWVDNFAHYLEYNLEYKSA